MENLRFKWVGRYSKQEKQFRFFRIMWETYGKGPDPVCRWSHKLSVSIKNWMPRITFRRCNGGIFV